jgi:dUTP pyrophosphatase
MPLKVKVLNPLATPPTIAHPGEDLAFDVYALRATHQPVNADGTPAPWVKPQAGMSTKMDLTGKVIHPIRIEAGKPLVVSTGISIQFVGHKNKKYGLLVRDRSSLASRGIFITGGVIDPSYTGELKIILNQHTGSYLDLWPGDKIAQLVPIEQLADTVEIVSELAATSRGEAGFGSSGQ